MDFKEYKNYHENYMKNNSGTTIEECFLLLSTVPLLVFLSCSISSPRGKLSNFVFEMLTIMIPVVLNSTIFLHVVHILCFYLFLICLTVIFFRMDFKHFTKVMCVPLNGNKPFISNFRAGTNLFSALCILAVDFIVFPKQLAKTESFGFGFMDLGVGFFICCNGFVEKHKYTVQFKKLIKTELILCALGLVRVLSVKSIDYHEHISEYGVHWNFFFTLASCKLVSYFVLCIFNNTNLFYVSALIGFIHQSLLSMGLQDWVLSNTPRISFISANKEGLVSCLGYVTLYFTASAIGKYILNPNNTTYKKLLPKLFLVCIIMWAGTGVSVQSIGVSRRLVNLGFIFWILALSLTELIFFILFELCAVSFKTKNVLTVPNTFNSINSYGLTFFLLSNLLTGLINLMFQTLLMGELIGLMIIIGYVVILCGVVCIMHLKKFFFPFNF